MTHAPIQPELLEDVVADAMAMLLTRPASRSYELHAELVKEFLENAHRQLQESADLRAAGHAPTIAMPGDVETIYHPACSCTWRGWPTPDPLKALQDAYQHARVEVYGGESR